MTPAEYLDALLALPRLIAPKVSPDGRWVAWTWFGAGPAADVYAAAAVERARHDAARVRDAVLRAGGDAVSASADDLPPLVADRYLALKAAGRL